MSSQFSRHKLKNRYALLQLLQTPLNWFPLVPSPLSKHVFAWTSSWLRWLVSPNHSYSRLSILPYFISFLISHQFLSALSFKYFSPPCPILYLLNLCPDSSHHWQRQTGLSSKKPQELLLHCMILGPLGLSPHHPLWAVRRAAPEFYYTSDRSYGFLFHKRGATISHSAKAQRSWAFQTTLQTADIQNQAKRLVRVSWWEGLAVGKNGSCSSGQGHAQ